MTSYYNWKQTIPKEELETCITILKQDGILVMPTETVYGIGANALSKDAVRKVYQAKGRQSDNPLIVHVADEAMLQEIVEQISPIEKQLIDAFMRTFLP